MPLLVVSEGTIRMNVCTYVCVYMLHADVYITHEQPPNFSLNSTYSRLPSPCHTMHASLLPSCYHLPFHSYIRMCSTYVCVCVRAYSTYSIQYVTHDLVQAHCYVQLINEREVIER